MAVKLLSNEVRLQNDWSEPRPENDATMVDVRAASVTWGSVNFEKSNVFTVLERGVDLVSADHLRRNLVEFVGDEMGQALGVREREDDERERAYRQQRTDAVSERVGEPEARRHRAPAAPHPTNRVRGGGLMGVDQQHAA